MSDDKGISRRGFLKAAAAVGAAFAIEPTLTKVQVAERAISGHGSAKNPDMQYRTLGTGNAAMEVSALGFGVMGMTYNRSSYPSKDLRKRVIAEAVDRGSTCLTPVSYMGHTQLSGRARYSVGDCARLVRRQSVRRTP